jgi:hypothetical protein
MDGSDEEEKLEEMQAKGLIHGEPFLLLFEMEDRSLDSQQVDKTPSGLESEMVVRRQESNCIDWEFRSEGQGS